MQQLLSGHDGHFEAEPRVCPLLNHGGSEFACRRVASFLVRLKLTMLAEGYVEISQHEQLVERLDVIIGLLQVAHAPQLEVAREVLFADPVSKALLESAEDWVPAGVLTTAVAKSCSVSERTVQRAMAELLTKGFLRNRGAARSLEYRSTGVL